MRSFKDGFAEMPLIAILRGIEPAEVRSIASALIDAGFSVIEVPLNSPEALRSIELLASYTSDRCAIGAGTLIAVDDVHRVRDAGGNFIVMPHSDVELIGAVKSHGMHCFAGVATPTEGFAALKAHADGLKLFPAEMMGPAVVKAWLSVLPRGTCLVPVGGITPESIPGYQSAGAAGFGIGSSLYRPGMLSQEVASAASAFVAAWRTFDVYPSSV